MRWNVTAAATLGCVLAWGTARADEPTYEVRLADLERRVEELKQQIRATKPRPHPVARTTLRLHARTSSALVLRHVRVTVDGSAVYDADAPAAEMQIVTDRRYPTDADVDVEMQFAGSDRLFTYMRGYRFTLHTARLVGSGEIDLVAYEKGGVSTPIEQRLAAAWSP
jgi:hypothetical protein